MFTAGPRRRLDDEKYRALQIALLLRLEQGAVIRGCGGARTFRWATSGRGKRGGLRVIYYLAVEPSMCYRLFVDPKNDQGDLTPGQVKVLARRVREEFK